MAVPFRFVLVGSGNIANTYVQALRGVPEASLVAVVSRSGARPTRMGSGEKVEIRPSLRDVTTPFDGVILATPPGLHADGAVEAAALGRHALTEKPLATTIEGADRAIAACRAAGVTLGCCYQRRLSPDNASVRKMVVEGKLGRIMAADMAVKFFRGQDYYDSAPYRGTWRVDGGGAFMQQASHQVDLYGWFFGRPSVVRAAAGTLAHRMESEDHGAAILVHDNGMIGTFVASTVARPGFPPRLEIHAEAGSVIMENDVITRWLVPDIPNPSRPSSEPIHSGAGAGGAAVTDTSGHQAVIADFIQSAREGRSPVAGGEEARLATELIVEIYRGRRHPPMMRVLFRRADGSLDSAVRAEGLAAALAEPGSLVWVDFNNEPDEACERILREIFHFHPLAIDDALKESHVPKLDDWGTYLYLVLHAVSFDAAAEEQLSTHELDIFAGPAYLVTHREHDIEPLNRLWDHCERDERITARGAARLLYHLVDDVVASHMPVADAVDAELERIEERVLAAAAAALPEVLRIKRSLLHLRRIVAPQRETLNRLARDEFAAVAGGERIYFRDVYDHLVRLYDITEGLRDLAAGMLDTYLSVVNNRMNEVMKTFTLITTLFMPISFVTGFFGMNFFTPESPPPGWTARLVFGAVCAGIVLLPFLMFLWLRRRRWV